MKHILAVFGTRPEAIKMAPVVNALKKLGTMQVSVCVTAQHRQMLDQVLELFNIVPDIDLNVMQPKQDLSDITSRVLLGLRDVFTKQHYDMVLVHGDTTTTMAAALAAFYAKIPIGHIEAGLRTGDKYAPWPEEGNRKLAGAIADIHFAPTETSRQNLLREGISDEVIHVTGNTVIDALLDTAAKSDVAASQFNLDASKKLILVTGHRRENFGGGFENICNALLRLAVRGDVQIVYPVHLNPNVQEPVNRLLGNHPSIQLIAPQDYLPFVYLMKRAYMILTDSGGIQEEAPSLGKPVLVLRDVTERPEAVAAGTVKLVGTDEDRIVAAATELLENADAYAAMSKAANPYGDGHASERIAKHIMRASVSY
ncbi:MAG: non-hydrolyzing UDP-N-acetylglucosamine 2-epimerase [Rickettsiales bacterium]